MPICEKHRHILSCCRAVTDRKTTTRISNLSANDFTSVGPNVETLVKEKEMKLIVHPGTGTIIDADDRVYIIDTDAINDEALVALLEDGDEKEIVDIALFKGRLISGQELELTYGNSMTFAPSALRVEAEENTFVKSRIGDEASAWIQTASSDALAKIAEFVLNNDLLWEHYCEIVSESISEVYQLDTRKKTA